MRKQQQMIQGAAGPAPRAPAGNTGIVPSAQQVPVESKPSSTNKNLADPEINICIA